MAPSRLAIVVSHPVQHFVSFYRALAAEPDITPHVIFGNRTGVKSYFDIEMRAEIAWKMDMLGGYSHEFLDPSEQPREPTFLSVNSPRLGGALSAFAPDAVLLYGYAQLNALRALAWCRSHKVPAMIISDSQWRETTGLKAALKRIVVSRIFKRCSAFLSVGDQNEQYYRFYGAPADRIFRSPFTIDEGSYRAAAARRVALRAKIRSELGLIEEQRALLFVGKLSPRKRPGDLLDALVIRAGQGETGEVALFAGNGELSAALAEQATALGVEARFLGFTNVDRLPSIYAAADILVHPSQADPHPLVCSEAACIGLPMILSDRIGAAGPTDIARPGVNALTYPCSDVSALAARIAELAADPARLREMSAASLRVFDELDMRRSVTGARQALEAILA